MPTYRLCFGHLDSDTRIRPLTIDGESPAELAQAVHRHARGYLGSRSVDIHLDDETLTGSVLRNGSPVGEFTLTADRATQPTEHTVLHGYTAADIDDIARHTIALDRWRTGDVEERLAAVRFAIVEHLCTTDETPTRRGLIGIGLHAADRYVVRELHHHGWDIDNLKAGSGAMASYQRYWQTAPSPSPERRIVERHAVRQIWSQLTPRQQEALEALAATGDYELAASALGVAAGTYRVLISQARRRYLTWWHEGETPTTIWRTDRHLHSRNGEWRGQRRLTVSQVEKLRVRYQAQEATLTALAAEAGVHKSTLSALFAGRTKPAPDLVGEAA